MFRILLVLLLAATLPVRGVAAATMLFCADNATAMMADHGTQHALSGEEHAVHDMAAHAAHHAPASEADASPDTADGQTDSHHAGCGSSGACCTGVAAGPLLTQPVTPAPLARPIPFCAPLYASVDLDHAERPPLA